MTISKGEKADLLHVSRTDGTRVEITFPKKGPIPHDAVHFIVEQTLGLHEAFWGMIDAGRRPEEIQALAKAAGHASAERAGVPDRSITQLLQAERLVECFEAETWSTPTDMVTLRAVVAAACEASHIPSPSLEDGAIDLIRARIADLKTDWMALPAGQSLRLNWPGGPRDR